MTMNNSELEGKRKKMEGAAREEMGKMGRVDTLLFL